MESVFRSDITAQESSFFFKNTFLLPAYLDKKYSVHNDDVKKVIDEVKVTLPILTSGAFNFSDAVITESFLKKCFSKCKQFVLEDWVDYDELDCTMRCTLLHKKSLELMKDVNKNI